MADGVAITAGSGTTILTDDTGATGHAQVVKLAIATDGSATLIPADANGLTVKQGTAANLNVTEASAASALTSLQLIDDTIFADDAAFTVGTSKVTMAGYNAVAHGSNPDAADAGDAVATITNRHRVPFVIGGHPNVISYAHSAITTAVTDSAMVTISTGSKIVVTRLTVTLDNASTVFPTVKIGFGTATIAAIGNNGILYAHGGFPAGGGQTIGDGSGIIGVGADNEDLRITTTGNATGNGLQVSVSYYTIDS